MFVDRVKIQVQGGRGGNGCLSFRREKYVPLGGPDGGNGGEGGSVFIVAESGVDHLSALAHRKHWHAENGKPGSGANKSGKNGEDLIIRVPPGTLIADAVAGHILKDLTEVGEQVVIAKGGRGGFGNLHYKSATVRAPTEHTDGEPGELRELILELKAIADVGLVGLPNAGKSTLLSRLSRARPEIAAYPFTTKHPNLGQVHLDAERSFVLADIPGLIEGAHEGHGLGHEFLRHIERAGVLVHLVEPEPADGADPLANYRAIRNELASYSAELGERPEIIAVTKVELPAGKEVRDRLAAELGREVFAISAVTGEGLSALVQRVASEVATRRQPAQDVEPAPRRVPPHLRNLAVEQ